MEKRRVYKDTNSRKGRKIIRGKGGVKNNKKYKSKLLLRVIGAKLYIKNLFEPEREVLELIIKQGIDIPDMGFAHEVKIEIHKLLCKLKGLNSNYMDVYTRLIYNK